MKFPIACMLTVLLASGAMAAKPKSIVGKWRFAQETCDMAITIGPMSMTSEDVNCRFTSVRRDGNRVTWQGACDDAEGGSNETVVATEQDGRLTIKYMKGGNVLENLVRCPR